MSDRVCAHCGSEIADDHPTILFCDEHCTLSYLSDNDSAPDEPVTQGAAT